MTLSEDDLQVGVQMHSWATDLFPICRSITGLGVRKTLKYLQTLLPKLTTHEVPSGERVLDWIVPEEWNVRAAWVEDSSGTKILDFDKSNLHLMGYSEPIDRVVSREELEQHLYSLPDQPEAIPYVTSYYSRNWGFCLSEIQRTQLGPGPFRVVIDSTLAPGSLTYGELVIPGETTEEILLSTYVCHPSMGNNELSGPVVTTALARWLQGLQSRRYTYRILFIPETIGSIVYLSRHLEHLRSHVRAGWVVTCIGDERTYSYVPSRLGGTLADRVSLQVLSELESGFDEYTFLDRGSDERQWCSPGADLPVCSVMRSKYGTYPEYHTSLDDLTFVTPSGLAGGYKVLKLCIELLEANDRWVVNTVGEPQLGRRGLYPTTSLKGSATSVSVLRDVVTYCDGNHDVLDLCDRIGVESTQVLRALDELQEHDIVRKI